MILGQEPDAETYRDLGAAVGPLKIVGGILVVLLIAITGHASFGIPDS